MPTRRHAPARIYRGTLRNLRHLARRLQAGELVAVPTETVYGLAADATNAEACKGIYRAKGRPTTDPLIVHVHSLEQAATIAAVPPAARALAQAFWPGPLTLVLPKTCSVPDIVTAGLSTVALRMPAHPLFRRLLKLTERPLAAPSANPFGYISPTTARHVRDNLGDRIAHILDGGRCSVGLESTIVDLRRPADPRVLRPGPITAAQIASVLGRAVATRAKRVGAGRAAVAPGLLKRHYSPRTPVTLHRRIPERKEDGEAYVLMHKPRTAARAGNVFWFDHRGDQRRVGRELFAMLRRLDERGFRRIHVELAPAGALAEAINDRLRRAAAR